jgi:serine/threonine-protein kinase
MAPELFHAGEIGRRTDVWGAAATAFDLRYGHPPFDSVGAIIDPSQPARFPDPASPAEAYFQDVLRRMLEKDLRRRPPDMTAPLHHFAMLAKALEPPAPKATRFEGATLLLGNLRLSFVVGDIASAAADAIVNSANFELSMRTGCGEALRRKGGDALEEEAQRGGEQPLGTCIATRPGALATKHVFHAVSAWNEVSCVGRAFARALLMAEEHGCHSLAAPALGTGSARVSLEMCANAMMTTLRWHAMLGGSRLREVTIFLDAEAKRRAFQDIAEEDLGLTEMRQVGAVDLGLPVENATPTSEGATFLDPRKHTTS